MSDDLIKRYNLDEDDFWTLRGNKIISFDGVIKIIDAEGIKFEMSDNLDVSPSVAIKVRAYIEPNDMNELHETIEEITFGEANDSNCKNQYFWAMAEKRGKARAALKVLGLYGKNKFYSDVEADEWTKKSPTIKQIEKFNSLEKKAIESGILDKDARNWLKSNQNGIRSNVQVWEKAMKALEMRGVK
tara:strand:- start:727 stop:1287 length:561 start_codon:yes stop_codon:yes gene_type:complete